jgi:hypothetical protein
MLLASVTAREYHTKLQTVTAAHDTKRPEFVRAEEFLLAR